MGPPSPLIDLLSIIYSAEQSLTHVTAYAASQMDETLYGCQSERVCLRLDAHLCPLILLNFINIMIKLFIYFCLFGTLPNYGMPVYVYYKAGLPTILLLLLKFFLKIQNSRNSTLAASSVLVNDASSLVEMASQWGPNKASRP